MLYSTEKRHSASLSSSPSLSFASSISSLPSPSSSFSSHSDTHRHVTLIRLNYTQRTAQELNIYLALCLSFHDPMVHISKDYFYCHLFFFSSIEGSVCMTFHNTQTPIFWGVCMQSRLGHRNSPNKNTSSIH